MTEDKATPDGEPEKKKKPATAKKKAAPRKKAAAKAEGDGADGDGAEPAKKPARKKAAPKAKAKTATKKAAPKKKAPARGKKAAAFVPAEPMEEISEGEAGSGSGPALVIVESPAKAKTINKFLGKDYVVKASMGHVRDLPKKDMGIAIEKHFEPEYQPLDEKRKVINELRRTAKNASAIYLACDNDREGEAIAWHISELLKARKDRTFRVTFNEITKSAIQKAFESPRQVDMAKVNAQQARRILDRIVGYKLSPLLWRKIGKRDLSAGRVQSVAVKLVVEREREIKAFNPIEYWDLEATLAKHDAPPLPPPPPESAAPAETDEAKAGEDGKAGSGDGASGKSGEGGEKAVAARSLGPGRFFAKLVQVGEDKLDPQGFRVKNEAEATSLREEVLAGKFVVSSIKKTERRDNPSPPFITSTLQQQASTRLRFATNRTMRLAQQLYEGVELGSEGSVGLITYMRTDSFNLAAEAVDEVRGFIKQSYGASYLPDEAKVYKREAKAGAQEAHEAIRPTSALRTPESVAQYLSPEQLKLYQLIWERFVACQMPPAVYSQTTVEVAAGKALFRASGRTLIFDGYQRVSGAASKKDEPLLPDLDENELLNCEKLQASQHFTQPPPRYTEASLVQTLEKLGIGRPSTYAAIVSTIQDRGYVAQENRRFHATSLGMIVTDKLQKHFEKVMDTDFTRSMEERLDGIEEEKVDWTKVLSDFYGPFEKELEDATQKMIGLNETPEESTIPCKKCGRLMVYKYNKRDLSRFLGCPGYNTEDKCTETMPVDEAGAPQVPEETDETCPECGSSMVIRTGRRGRFLACSAYPNCKVTRELADEGGGQLMPELEAECENCGKKMVVRRGRRGPFLGCTGYPECKTTRPIVMQDGKAAIGEKREAVAMPEVDEKCERCGSPMKIRMSRRGPFLGCTAYPKCRGTGQLSEELKAKLPAPPPPKELGENCDLCGKPMLIRQGRRGPFAGCSGYPKCKNTKQVPAGA